MEIVPSCWPQFELSVEDLGELVGLTMWELIQCMNILLSLAIALQVVEAAYGVNPFYELMEDLDGCMVKLLECLRNPGHRLGIVMGCNRFMEDGAPPLKIFMSLKILLNEQCNLWSATSPYESVDGMNLGHLWQIKIKVATTMGKPWVKDEE
eukprot:Gb_10504 [translate_table: standard]